MRNRRGLSTVVGAVFFVIAATTVMTYISFSMNTIDQFAESVIVQEAENINRGLEDITISKISIDGGEFNMTVVNTGSLPVHLTRLWITDEDSAVPDKKIDLDVRINPGKEAIKIGQGTGVSADSAISYSLKAVTERGNLATFQVSPDVSTQLQLIAPAEVQPGENIRVTAYITNNSTKPNNIANLIPIVKNNATLTVIDGPLPPSIQTLPQGNTAVFAWTYVAPDTAQGVSFNVTYTGAPTPVPSIWSNTTVALSAESEAASTSQWSQAASRVGILISGIPNPIEATNSAGPGKWGVGIINPLDREVEIYAIAISTPGADFLANTVEGLEPDDFNWSLQTSANNIVLWESGATPRIIPAQSVAQFRVTTQATQFTSPQEMLVLIQALSSEGKLNALYSVTAKSTFPTMNMYYTSDPLFPSLDDNWGYLVENIPSGKAGQIFNATVENASGADMQAYIKLIILIPADFSNVESEGDNTGWDTAIVATNPDGSTVISVQTDTKPFETGTQVYQFKADAPAVSSTKLYVFQTTSVYIDWTTTHAVQIASALSEAGVQVVP